MAKTATCAILAQGVTTKIIKTNNGTYLIPYNFSGAIVCSDGTSIPSQILTLDYTIKYTEPYVHRLPQELEEYNVEDWTDYQELKKLETGLVKQVIARCVIFAAKLSVDMADTHNRASDFLLCNIFRNDLLLVQNLLNNQENAYTHN